MTYDPYPELSPGAAWHVAAVPSEHSTVTQSEFELQPPGFGLVMVGCDPGTEAVDCAPGTHAHPTSSPAVQVPSVAPGATVP